MVSADDKTIIEMHMSGGTKHDAPEGRTSIEKADARFKGVPLLMDRAYEGDKTRALASSYSRGIRAWLTLPLNARLTSISDSVNTP